ncbi:MAG: bifunctional 5,10-methylenetetrahydrofolate dehydrogenase/5,10-methenyltetrahydrofolate cyclohydrolase, partial [Patescibacteria group bacterium]|nr:bifunctional 5,10-methylenetetrahydrofolate dehydrogenase/5,10-methenyltetrahydrofolate cyclohydrolase [Patescibacteria group bacterium]
MKTLDGRKLSKKILKNLEIEIKAKKLKLKLAVILVGKDRVSEIFTLEKQKACEKIGIDFKLFRFSSKIKLVEFKKEIKKIANNHFISGIVIQLPLPKHLDSQEVFNLIPFKKDIDILSELGIGKFYTGMSPIIPPTVQGINHLFKEYRIPLKGKNIVVVGKGRLVGCPSVLWLLKQKSTVIAVDKFVKDISFFTKNADIIISGTGNPNLITNKMIKKGVVLIDAGTCQQGDKLMGDIDTKSVSKKANYISPVPG